MQIHDSYFTPQKIICSVPVSAHYSTIIKKTINMILLISYMYAWLLNLCNKHDELCSTTN